MVSEPGKHSSSKIKLKKKQTNKITNIANRIGDPG